MVRMNRKRRCCPKICIKLFMTPSPHGHDVRYKTITAPAGQRPPGAYCKIGQASRSDKRVKMRASFKSSLARKRLGFAPTPTQSRDGFISFACKHLLCAGCSFLASTSRLIDENLQQHPRSQSVPTIHRSKLRASSSYLLPKSLSLV